MKSNQRWILFLYISCLIHLTASGALYFLSDLSNDIASKTKSNVKLISVELIESDDSLEKQAKKLIPSLNIPYHSDNESEALKKPAKFYSQHTIRVPHEQVSKNSNTSSLLGQTNPPPPNTSQVQNPNELNKSQNKDIPSETKNNTPKAEDGYKPLPQFIPNQNQRPTSHSRQNGVLNINQVNHGTFTALNSDQLEYYSFFVRIEEQVSGRWNQYLENAFIKMRTDPSFRNLRSTWITHAEFVLDPNGYIKKVLLLKSSGRTELDLSATQAFLDVRAFPNPPREMIGKDGMIHLNYRFQVNYDPSWLAHNSN